MIGKAGPGRGVLGMCPYSKRPRMVPRAPLDSSKFLLKINEDRESRSSGKKQSGLSVKITNRQFETVDPASNSQNRLSALEQKWQDFSPWEVQDKTVTPRKECRNTPPFPPPFSGAGGPSQS